MELKQIIEQKRAAAEENRLKRKREAAEQAVTERLALPEPENDREIQIDTKKLAPVSSYSLVASKRSRIDSESIPEPDLFVEKTEKQGQSPSKPEQSANDTKFKIAEDNHDVKTTQSPPLQAAFAPAHKPRRSKSKAVYKQMEVVDTRKKPSEWYLNVNMKQKFPRGDLQIISYVKTIIKNCLEAAKNQTNTERCFSELRTKIHEMEFYEFISGILIQKSKILESEGLSQIFEEPNRELFPWDISTDAEALWLRWMSGDLDPSLLRGISSTKGVLQSGMKRTSHKLEKDYSQRKSANVFGANNLLNGRWWPSRICVLRDGAHGEQEAGIHGQAGKGAYSVVIAAGGYADIDNGESIEYCGTASETPEPTKNTRLLVDSYLNKKPLRVLRAVNKKSQYAPKRGVRYDGLYDVTGKEILDAKTAMFRFSLVRQHGQHPIRYGGVEVRPTPQELKELMKGHESTAPRVRNHLFNKFDFGMDD